MYGDRGNFGGAYIICSPRVPGHAHFTFSEYNYKGNIEWEKLMNAREAEMEDDVRSVCSENSMDQALMAENTIPDLPEALPLQDEEPPTHCASTGTTHVLWTTKLTSSKVPS
jgi:hypothetical protein